MATYLVTGGTGFLGTHVVQHLAAQNADVRVVARVKPVVAQVPGNVRYQAADCANTAQLAELANGCAGIFHLAGAVEHSRSAWQRMHDANVQTTLSVLQAAAQAEVPRVVYASTSGVVALSFNPNMQPVTDDAPYAEEQVAAWPYYAAKLEAERQARQLVYPQCRDTVVQAAELGVDLVCMRPSLLLGPGDVRLSSCRSVWDLINGRIPWVPRGGVSFVDVRDAAAAFVAAMMDHSAAGPYLLASANVPTRTYFEMIAAAAQVAVPMLPAPPDAVAKALAYALWRVKSLALGQEDPSLNPVFVEMSTAYWYCDPEAAIHQLQWQPRTPETTIQDTVDWLRGHAEALK